MHSATQQPKTDGKYYLALEISFRVMLLLVSISSSLLSSSSTDYFPIRKGTLLASCYKVQAFLGEGCFGKVARCVNIATNTKVAIKITKDKPCFTAQALEEVEHKHQN